MTERDAKNKVTRGADKSVPSGFESLAELVFDDDPIEDIIYGRHGVPPTPADLMRIITEDHPISEDTVPHLASLLARNREYLQLVCESLSTERFAALAPRLLRVERERLEPKTVISLGVRLGFHGFVTGNPSIQRRAWGQVADVYRDHMNAPADPLAELVDHSISTLKQAAGEYWGRRPTVPADGHIHQAVEFLLLFDSTEAAPTRLPKHVGESVDHLMGSQNSARVLARSMQVLFRDANPTPLIILRSLTTIAIAAAAAAGSDHPIVGDVLNRIFVILVRRALSPDVLLIGKRSLELREATLGYEHPLTQLSRTNLGGALTLLGEFESAEEVLGGIRETSSSDWHKCYWLARFYEARGQGGDSELEALAWMYYLNNNLPSVARRWEATRRLTFLKPCLTGDQGPVRQ